MVSTTGFRVKSGMTKERKLDFLRDRQFYYPENLEELENRGGGIIEIHAMGDSAPPAYINVLCLYAHIHALGEQRWADAMIREAELRQ